MTRAGRLALAGALLLAAPALAQAPARPGQAVTRPAGPPAPEKPTVLRVDATVALRGAPGRWGTPVVDDLNRRLYLPRGPAGLSVLALDGFRPLAEVADTAGSAAVALDPDTLRGFSANALETSPGGPAATGVTVFDQRGFKPVGKLDLAGVRHILYDAATRQVAALGEDGTLSLIDPAKLTVTATLALDSKRPMALAADRRGRVFVALADRDAIAVVDMVARVVATQWKPRGCRTPVALAFDSFGQRLVAACRGAPAAEGIAAAEAAAVAIDPFSGAAIAALSVPPGVDAAIHDAAQRVMYFTSSLTASVMAYRQVDAFRYAPLESVGTRPLAGAAAADPRTARLLLPVAEYVTTPSRPDGSGGQRILPNSAALLVMKRVPLE